MYHYISALNFAIHSSNVQDNLLSTFVLKSNEIFWIIFKIEELINIAIHKLHEGQNIF